MTFENIDSITAQLQATVISDQISPTNPVVPVPALQAQPATPATATVNTQGDDGGVVLRRQRQIQSRVIDEEDDDAILAGLGFDPEPPPQRIEEDKLPEWAVFKEKTIDEIKDYVIEKQLPDTYRAITLFNYMSNNMVALGLLCGLSLTPMLRSKSMRYFQDVKIYY